MNLHELKRGIQIQQGEGADELIVRSGLPVEQLLEPMQEDLEQFPIHAVRYYQAGLLSREDARDYCTFYSAKHVAAFYRAGLITLAEAREDLDDIKEVYGIGQFLNLYDAGILTLQEIAPYSHTIFFGYPEQREKLVERGLISQEMLDQYTLPSDPFGDDSSDEDQIL